MLNVENALISEGCEKETKVEPVKSILENTDAILNELSFVLRQIDDAVYSPKNIKENADMSQDECLLATLNRQRTMATELLHTAMHIKEGLW